MLKSLYHWHATFRYITSRLQGMHEPCLCQLQQRKRYQRLQNPIRQKSQCNNSRTSQVIWTSGSKTPQCYTKMANLSFPRISNTDQLHGIIVTSNTQAQLVSKRLFLVQCIGRVYNTLSNHTSNSVTVAM